MRQSNPSQVGPMLLTLVLGIVIGAMATYIILTGTQPTKSYPETIRELQWQRRAPEQLD